MAFLNFGSLAAVATLFVASVSGASIATSPFDSFKASSSLQWHSCLSGLYCAKLSVPLDYNKPNGYKATLALVKLPAAVKSTDKNYKGTLIYYNGQLGDSGVLAGISLAASPLRKLVANYDVISFDPRGVGLTTPSARCLGYNEEQETHLIDVGLGNPGSSNVTVYQLWANYRAYNQICKETIGGSKGAGKHMTAAVIARDLITIVDAVQAAQSGYRGKRASAVVNFWGVQYYGSQVGQTFAAQYPGRVGRFVLDGNTNAASFAALNDLYAYASADEVLRQFFIACYNAGPSKCTYAKVGTSAADLEAKFYALVDQLETTPAIVLSTVDESESGGSSSNAPSPNFVDSSYIKQQVYYGLLPGVAAYPAIDAALTGIYNTVYQTPQGIFPTTRTSPAGLLLSFPTFVETASTSAEDDAFITQLSRDVSLNNVAVVRAGLCSDAPPIYETAAQFLPYLRKALNASELTGDRVAQLRLLCTSWQIRPTMRFAGPFKAKTKTGILFVDNTFDPLTPDSDGNIDVSDFPGARQLQVKGVGHTSFAVQSPCAFAAVSTYFNTGALPPVGKICGGGLKPFA